MARFTLTTLALVAVIALEAPAQDAGLEKLRWLAGCWELQRGHRQTIEMWMAPAGGLMLGASRTIVGGTVREFEQVRLSLRDGKIVYTASPSGQARTDFTASAIGDSGFTVENPAHDFPQRIIYARRGADSLVARIEGNTPNGPRGVDYPMRRVRCEAS